MWQGRRITDRLLPSAIGLVGLFHRSSSLCGKPGEPKQDKGDLVYVKQFKSALHWLHVFATSHLHGLRRIIHVSHRNVQGATLATDASLWSGVVGGWVGE